MPFKGDLKGGKKRAASLPARAKRNNPYTDMSLQTR